MDLASGNELAVRDFVLKIARAIGRVDLVRLGARPAPPQDVPRVVGDPAEASSLLGWEPKISLQDGIMDTIEWGRGVFERCSHVPLGKP